MPYKDINQQREKARVTMRILRAQRKGITEEEIARLTADGLTKKKRVNLVNKTRLTNKNNPSLNSQILANLVSEVRTEIRNSQQTFFSQMENLIRSELGKVSPKNSKPASATKIAKQTTFRTKSLSSRGKVKVDIAALVQATGLQVD